MKKRFLLLFLCAMLLTGCGSAPVKVDLGAEHLSVVREDMKIALGAPAAPVLEALGAPFGYAESKSRTFTGVEKTYRFSGMNLKTYQDDDGDRILGVMITDNTVKTPEGVAIGDTAEQVRSIFGEDAIQDNCCIVRSHSDRMILLLERNIVTAIQYTLM